MKVVTYDKQTNVVIEVFDEVFHPEIDEKNGIITHENGTFHRANNDRFGYLLVDDFVLVEPGQEVNEPLRDLDRTEEFTGHNFTNIVDAIKTMGSEVAKEIKDLFGVNKKHLG